MLLFDTGPLVAFENPSDSEHHRAKRLMSDALGGRYGQLVSTDHVLVEGIAVLMARRAPRQVEERFSSMFHGSRNGFVPILSMRYTTPDILEEAIELRFGAYDRKLSITDCTLAVFAKRLGATLVTLDRRLAGIAPALDW